MSAQNLLEVKNLEVQYATSTEVVHAVNGVSFFVKEGECLGLVGETGAGKTSTALSILRLLSRPTGKVTKGEIIFNGQDLLKLSEADMRDVRGDDITMIFQDPMTALNPVKTVGDQIAEVVRVHKHCTKADAEEQACKMLESVGIQSDRYKDFPHQFSGGMKQRVVIAMALACEPKLLLADEPTTALDVTIQAQVIDMMVQLRQKYNMSMIFITHDLGIVADICDNVGIMYAGEIVEYGTLEDIFDARCHPYTRGLFESIPSLTKDVVRLTPIPGLAPDPADLPGGCVFHDRCRYATDQCKEFSPKAVEVTSGHVVRCHLYAKESGKSE